MPSPGRASARKGADSRIGAGFCGSFFSITMIATKPIAISAVLPKKGPRQLMLPSSPPMSGPIAMPSPRAAS